MKKTLVGWVIYGIILPIYMKIIINHCKDPYETTSIMKSRRVFLVAHILNAREKSGGIGL